MEAAAEVPIENAPPQQQRPAVVEEELAGIQDLTIAPDTPFPAPREVPSPSASQPPSVYPTRSARSVEVQTDLRLPTSHTGMVIEVENIERASPAERE